MLVSQEIPLPSANRHSNVKLFEDEQKAARAGMLIESLPNPGQPTNVYQHLHNVNTAYL